jgi:hypothetical protein
MSITTRLLPRRLPPRRLPLTSLLPEFRLRMAITLGRRISWMVTMMELVLIG